MLTSVQEYQEYMKNSVFREGLDSLKGCKSSDELLAWREGFIKTIRSRPVGNVQKVLDPQEDPNCVTEFPARLFAQAKSFIENLALANAEIDK